MRKKKKLTSSKIPARRTTLTELEWAAGELLVTPDEDSAIVWYLRGTYVSHLGMLYKACCIIGEYSSVEHAKRVAEELALGSRMKGEDTRPSRVWTGKGGRDAT
jgi:hypothetical protein